jgi:hypothetical protein
MYFNFPALLFLFLKGMMGALSPFSYLVFNNLLFMNNFQALISIIKMYKLLLLLVVLVPMLLNSFFSSSPNKLECFACGKFNVWEARSEPTLVAHHSMSILLGPYSQHFIYLSLTIGPDKLVCYITLSQKGLLWINTLAYWAHSKGTKKMKFLKTTIT